VTAPPSGGVQTGLGGTAAAQQPTPPRLPDSDGLWAAILLLGVGTTWFAIRGWRRTGASR
jgi:hypothetical protein